MVSSMSYMARRKVSSFECEHFTVVSLWVNACPQLWILCVTILPSVLSPLWALTVWVSISMREVRAMARGCRVTWEPKTTVSSCLMLTRSTPLTRSEEVAVVAVLSSFLFCSWWELRSELLVSAAWLCPPPYLWGRPKNGCQRLWRKVT